MKALAALGAVTLLLAGCSSTVGSYPPTSSSTSSSTPPSPSGVIAAQWPVPDDRLTPGAVVTCSLPRPSSERAVPESEKDQVAAAYHYTGPRGLAYLEFDHRVPFALCGSNGPTNLWPEPYDGVHTSSYVHNYKDQLEAVVIRMVEHRQRPWMTLAAGQAVFLGDWRLAWCRYVHKTGVVC